MPDLSVDATHQLDVVRIRNGRSRNELGYRAGRVEALGHLPGVALGLQLALQYEMNRRYKLEVAGIAQR